MVLKSIEPLVTRRPDNKVGLFYFTRKRKFEALKALKELNCNLSISVTNQEIVIGNAEFDSLKEYMS